MEEFLVAVALLVHHTTLQRCSPARNWLSLIIVFSGTTIVHLGLDLCAADDWYASKSKTSHKFLQWRQASEWAASYQTGQFDMNCFFPFHASCCCTRQWSWVPVSEIASDSKFPMLPIGCMFNEISSKQADLTCPCQPCPARSQWWLNQSTWHCSSSQR